jgi:hypothetical protein
VEPEKGVLMRKIAVRMALPEPLRRADGPDERLRPRYAGKYLQIHTRIMNHMLPCNTMPHID